MCRARSEFEGSLLSWATSQEPSASTIGLDMTLPRDHGQAHGGTGGSLPVRTFSAQQKEVAIDISVLKRKIRAAKPVTVRVK